MAECLYAIEKVRVRIPPSAQIGGMAEQVRRSFAKRVWGTAPLWVRILTAQLVGRSWWVTSNKN